jgi:phenylacetate-coenzyme A ligase PaaK-like adenylate-forming protein
MKAAVLKTAERLFSAVGGYMKFLPKISAPLSSDSTEDEIKEYQRLTLQSLLDKASKVPLYKSLFKKYKIDNKKVDDIKGLESVQITDYDLRQNRRAMRNPSCFFYFTQTTSGTGGNPVKVDVSLKQLLNVFPIHKRSMQEFGFSGEGLVIIHRGSPSYYLALFSTILEGKVEFADYRDLNEQISKIVGKDYIVGYPTALLRLAKRIEGKEVADNIRLIVYSAEPLTDVGREVLKNTFTNAKIRSIYGSIETYGPIGYTCEKGNFHLNPDFAILEQDPKNNAIITLLDKDRGTVLIRYAGLKDKIWFTKCTCKSNFPAFKLKGTFRHIDGERIADAIYSSEAFKRGIIGPYFDWQLFDDPQENVKVIRIQLELIKPENAQVVKDELENIIVYGNDKVPPSKPLQDLKDLLKFNFILTKTHKVNLQKSPGLRRRHDPTV